MPSNRLTADDVVTNAKLMGVPPSLALSVWQQESSRATGEKPVVSPKGAVGPFQVMPGTFKAYGPKGGDINDPVDNMLAGLSYLREGLRRSGGDPEGAAQFYYSGRILKPGERGPTSGPGTPDVRTYGQQVASARGSTLDTGDQFGISAYPNGLPGTYMMGLPVEGQELKDLHDPDQEGPDMYRWRPTDEEGEPEQDDEEETPGVPAGYNRYLTDFLPYEGGFGGGQDDEQMNLAGQQDYELDNYIRRLVDEEINA